MMLPLDPGENLIVVPTRVFGPLWEYILRFALDTGATMSMLNLDRALELGYTITSGAERVEVTTASRIEAAPVITFDKIEALGQQRLYFPVLCYTLPPSAGVDGIL